MRKITTLMVALFGLTTIVSAQSRIEHLSLKSEVLGVEKVYSVYLPDGYDKSNENYPVLYLLHGAWGTNLSWVRADGVRGGNLQAIADAEIAAGRCKKMIIVTPDARGTGEKNGGKNMGYFNVENWNYMDFFFQEFIPHIDKTFRTIAAKDGRAIAGLSMGGGGSFVYAQRHPEMFNAAYSTSGLLDHRYRPKKIDNYENIGWYWSVAATSPVEYVRNASAETLEKLRSVRWMLDCGDDDGIIFTNLDFFIEMKREKVPVELRIRNGKHNWVFWRESLPEILAFSFK
jgi:enterochelin esterase-like enzyme